MSFCIQHELAQPNNSELSDVEPIQNARRLLYQEVALPVYHRAEHQSEVVRCNDEVEKQVEDRYTSATSIMFDATDLWRKASDNPNACWCEVPECRKLRFRATSGETC
jgi:hypothetical protein